MKKTVREQLSELIEKELKGLEDDRNRLRTENNDLRAKLLEIKKIAGNQAKPLR
jgi:hypothetical protein